jgi:hypothetical protein
MSKLQASPTDEQARVSWSGIESEREKSGVKGGRLCMHAFMVGWGFMRRERGIYSIDMRGFALCFCAWCDDEEEEEEGDE